MRGVCLFAWLPVFFGINGFRVVLMLLVFGLGTRLSLTDCSHEVVLLSPV